MWKNVIGQKSAVEKLKTAYKTRKAAHAYIFYGMAGVGKDAAAIEFAKLMNCLSPVNSDEACDKCENCLKISEFKSEFFNYICALPAGKSDQADADTVEKLSASDFDLYMDQIQFKSFDPYYHITLPGANNIRINSIRDIISKIYLTAGKNNTKVFLISEAEKMKTEASNALLKILEEPPKKSLIILTTSKINSLPPTVAGRCQRISFTSLTKDDILGKIQNDLRNKNEYFPECTKDEIELAARLSGGSYTRTVEFLQMGIKDIRNQAISYLISTVTGNTTELVNIVRTVTAKNNKDKTKYFLFFLNAWFSDIMKIKYSQPENGISNIDLADRLAKFNKSFSTSEIYNIVKNLEEAEKFIGQNVQLPLILINLSFKLKDYLQAA